MTIEFTKEEGAAIQRVVDAALKGSGVNILQEAGWLQSKLKAAFDAERIQPVGQPSTVKPEVDETPS